ncbi:MAG: DEAD/DEAH box helicase, partial [Deltaproteobacteria bacterium]|nr:DEAD/DEAH box helicase [Deltaproteobacteria bacterium]
MNVAPIIGAPPQPAPKIRNVFGDAYSPTVFFAKKSAQRHMEYRKKRPEKSKDRRFAPKPKPKPKLPPPSNETISQEVQKYLDLIGVPPERPFTPDPFQIEAVELVAEHDTIVSAPTGSGKTWIARQALAGLLESGGKAWYASPLKALSNSKYLEFSRDFGEANVGLVTGDHKINPLAPIVVGTTEILRNQLYDAMGNGSEIDFDLVILDEAHYLGDPERGVVWEEVLIYMPSRVRFLLLSATIENAQEIAEWMSFIRSQEVKVVSSDVRPVPLVPLCLNVGSLNILQKHKNQKAKKGRRDSRYSSKRTPFVRSGFPEGSPSTSLVYLESRNLLPAIFFLKSRKECDAAIVESPKITPGDTEERRAARSRFIDEYAEIHPILADYKP